MTPHGPYYAIDVESFRASVEAVEAQPVPAVEARVMAALGVPEADSRAMFDAVLRDMKARPDAWREGYATLSARC